MRRTSDSALHPPVADQHGEPPHLQLPGALARRVADNPTLSAASHLVTSCLPATLPVVVLVQLDQLARGEVHEGGDAGRAPASAIIGHPGAVGHAEGELPLVGGRGQLEVEHPEQEGEEALEAAENAQGGNPVLRSLLKRDNCRAKGSSHQRTFSRQRGNLLAPIDQSSFYWRVHKDNRGHRVRGGAMQRGSKCKTEVGGLCCSHHTLTGIWEVGCWEWIRQKSGNKKLYAGAGCFDNVQPDTGQP